MKRVITLLVSAVLTVGVLSGCQTAESIVKDLKRIGVVNSGTRAVDIFSAKQKQTLNLSRAEWQNVERYFQKYIKLGTYGRTRFSTLPSRSADGVMVRVYVNAGTMVTEGKRLCRPEVRVRYSLPPHQTSFGRTGKMCQRNGQPATVDWVRMEN